KREILLARVGDTFYAADNRCPHMGGSLSEGKLEKTIVTCPRHHSQFDLVDGHVVRWTDWSGIKLSLGKMVKSPRPVKTYKIKFEGGKVMAEVDKASFGIA
ncbi:MAG TPA: Rieske 2Fe-2S domain-containing protein, partial [Dehalococcoidia bacterium]|nr:Rieske 2Fe-2S domain-containing protein [Dehalococcoidia bacterium]